MNRMEIIALIKIKVGRLDTPAELTDRSRESATPPPICSASMTFHHQLILGTQRSSPLVPPEDQRLQRQDNRLHTKDQRVNEGDRIDDVQIDLLQPSDVL
jgi:hypothetical protein